MIADLKAKAEGFDRKRIYTAVAALVIAGAAGHFMQRGASAQSGAQALSASVPGKPPAATPAPQEPAPVVVAAAFTASPTPAAPAQAAQTPPLNLQAEQSQQEPESVSAELETVGSKIAGVEHARVPSSTVVAHLAGPIDMLEAVTRSSNDPLFALTEPEHEPVQAAAEIDIVALASAKAMTDTQIEPVPPVNSCSVTLDATAQEGALIALSIAAPCNSGENIEFIHAGLKFSEQLGPEGNLFVTVPAMSDEAIVIAEFADGQQKAVEVTLPDFASYERVALVWKGATGFQLHALEHGAGYGEPGHVWAEAPASVADATAGEGGFLSVLGSTAAGYAADVYTYPASLITDGAEPRVSVEAQVMENTCGGEIAGSILRSNAGRAPMRESLEMAVPGCDAVGEYLVLNNLPQDLKLARN